MSFGNRQTTKVLPGQNLPRQNHLATYWISWTESIPLLTHAQIIFALTKHVWYFVMQLQVDDGIYGRIQVNLSLIHIITSIIAPLITCAKNSAIQAHLMDQHQTLLWLSMTDL